MSEEGQSSNNTGQELSSARMPSSRGVMLSADNDNRPASRQVLLLMKTLNDLILREQAETLLPFFEQIVEIANDE